MSASAPTVDPTPLGTYDVESNLGLVLIQALGPWMTVYLAWYLDAVGVMADPVYNLASDIGVDDGTPTVGTYDQNGDLITTGYQPGYASALDPQQATAGYGYLGQYVGVSVPDGTDDATAKSLVLAEQGTHRGTNAAMIAAAQRFLTGTQSVMIIERTYTDGTPTAGWFLLVVRPEQLVNEQDLIDAVNAVKLGGLMWTLVQVDAPLLSQYTLLMSEITATLAAATLADVT